MPIGFQTGARPANTYILPPAAAPKISSAGSGNGASLTHFACACAAGVAAMQATNTSTNWSCPAIIFFDAICHSLTVLRIVALLFNCEGQRRAYSIPHTTLLDVQRGAD